MWRAPGAQGSYRKDSGSALQHSQGPQFAATLAGQTALPFGQRLRATKRGQRTVLTPKLCGISVAFGTASFFMTDNDKTVRVDVCQRLLASLEEPMPMTKALYVKRLLRYRARFAQIASAKYDEGQFDTEVNVRVVRISASDLH
jgi:hypothetical protein